ncbi:16S rRNA (cytidine(1402)-2'-O)-methyltransferase [Mycoplasma simbae]|uniref:16S rRNA (cytidine(1402)-2'-O)-methyltransferase n=1 Tax=Mycoplasma simbae TaxID=36744 RepID=UPI0004971242|nr:16S rRNA (cytidine(1402)-2'-O)-methyltransferase [Mycoplasma simbae]
MSKIYIVGTPIGNLKDITLRALETLKFVDLVACEDTRVSEKLLSHFGISKKLVSYSKIDESKSAAYIIDLILKNNLNVALVSDAGMPLVSDPGFELIKLARANNIDVQLVPGVNAAISAFALSGLSQTFTFHAFPKEKSGQRLKQIQSLDTENSHIFYVSPHKIDNFFADIQTCWGQQATIFVARELTKIHESFYLGSVEQVKEQLAQTSQKGEFTIVVKMNAAKREKINKYQHFSKVNH